jgi:CHASE3 domain sensor protein
MKIRTKVTLSSVFFLAVSSAVGSWCYLNIKKEETAFAQSRRATRTLAAVSDIEYFLTRQGRALQNYVLLNDEAEKLQFQQAESQMKSRLKTWRQTADNGETQGDEIANVQSAYELLATPARKINGLMETGKKTTAMTLVDSEFVPANKKATALFKDVKTRVETGAQQAEANMLLEVRQNHLTLMGGVGLVCSFRHISVIIPFFCFFLKSTTS